MASCGAVAAASRGPRVLTHGEHPARQQGGIGQSAAAGSRAPGRGAGAAGAGGGRPGGSPIRGWRSRWRVPPGPSGQTVAVAARSMSLCWAFANGSYTGMPGSLRPRCRRSGAWGRLPVPVACCPAVPFRAGGPSPAGSITGTGAWRGSRGPGGRGLRPGQLPAAAPRRSGLRSGHSPRAARTAPAATTASRRLILPPPGWRAAAARGAPGIGGTTARWVRRARAWGTAAPGRQRGGGVTLAARARVASPHGVSCLRPTAGAGRRALPQGCGSRVLAWGICRALVRGASRRSERLIPLWGAGGAVDHTRRSTRPPTRPPT